MAGISTINVYEGFWTDWTRGKLYGLTWTLSPTNGTLLTSSLALFVTLAGSQLWIVIRFAIHQLRASSGRPEINERSLQERIILRNAATDFNTVLLMLQLAWTSRRSSKVSFSFPALIVCLAMFHYLLFLTAGAFSNKLVTAGSSVLLRSQYCGVWNETYYAYIKTGMDVSSREGVSTYLQFLNKMQLNVLLSLDYARECYQDQESSVGLAACRVLPVSHLHVNQTLHNDSCPFESQMCHNGSATLVFDTGVIDSHRDLGINAPYHDRLTYRRVTSCAVLEGNDYVIETHDSPNGTSGAPALSTANAYYGPSILQDTNFTYSYSSFGSFYTDFTAQSVDPYLLNTQIAYGASRSLPGSSNFEPIREIKQDFADLILLFVSFTGRYFEPIDDPWFSAHKLYHEETRSPIARTQFAPDRMVSTLACTEQHQFCNTKDGSCTPLLGWGQVQDVDLYRTGLSARQNVTFDRMVRAADASSIAQITTSLAEARPPLLASAQAAVQSTAMSLHLPSNQWQVELRNWYVIALAQFQRTLMQWGTGDVAPSPQSQLVRPQTEPDSWFCDNMVIPSARHQSFSVIRLILIGVAGTAVIMISWNIENLTTWIRIRCGKDLTSKQIWDEDDMLRLKGNISILASEPRPTLRESFHSNQQLDSSEKGEIAATETEVGTYPGSCDQLKPATSTPRLWSELPQEPPRESWISISLNGQEKAERPRSILGSLRTPKGSVPLERGEAPEISNLRAHALARIYGTWI